MGDDTPTRSLAAGSDSTAPLRPAEAATLVPPAPPRRVGEIELLRELGRGGMGTVWLGHDTLLGRDVAVKFLLNAPASRDDPNFTGFVRSAELAAQVKSKRLTEIYSAGVSDGVPYLVMEYSAGVALSAVLHRHGAFSVPLTLAVMEAVCEGAADLHEHGVVHGDFKPANVLVESDGRIVVTDFGLAVARPREQVGGSAQGFGGTPAYMAPELFEGKATYQTDAYALGIMLYELLAGAPPFQGSFAELARRHREESVPVERLPDSVPAGLRELIARATEKSPRLRSKSGRHLLDALRRSVPDPSVWDKGRAELTGLKRTGGHSEAPADSASPGAPSSSYYDALHALSSSHAMARLESPAPDGEEMPAPLTPVGAPTDPRIVMSLACVACHYDLRGLAPDSACPECSTPIGESLDPERLIFADRMWLGYLNAGVLVSFFLFWPVGGLLATLRERPRPERANAGSGRDWVEISRVTARWCALAGCVLIPAMFVTPFFPAWLRSAPTDLYLAVAIVHSAAWAVWTNDLFRRGARASERSAGWLRALARAIRRCHRTPRSALTSHFVVLGALSVMFGVAVAAAQNWALPSSVLDGARSVLMVTGAAALTIAWARNALVHTPITEARKRHMNRAGLVSAGDGSPSAGAASDRAGRPVLSSLGPRGEQAIPCIGCAYDLAGLTVDAVCPECATPIGETIDLERLVFADEGWLRAVRRGLLCVQNAPAMLLIAPMVYGAVAGGLGAVKPGASASSMFGTGLALTAITLIVLCGYAGLWLATPKEPAPRVAATISARSPWVERSRRAVRVVVLVSLALAAIQSELWMQSGLPSQGAWWPLLVAQSAALVVGALAWGLWTDDLRRRADKVSKRRAGRPDAALAVIRRRRRGPHRTLLMIAGMLAVFAVLPSMFGLPLAAYLHAPQWPAMVMARILAMGAASPLIVWALAGQAAPRITLAFKERMDRAALLPDPPRAVQMNPACP